MTTPTPEHIADQTARFWELSESLMGGAVAEGSMMGSDCIRVNGDFAAMIHSKTGDLIVKLAAGDVMSEIEAGIGLAFAPNGRVFKEWLHVTSCDDDSWQRLLEKAVDFGS